MTKPDMTIYQRFGPAWLGGTTWMVWDFDAGTPARRAPRHEGEPAPLTKQEAEYHARRLNRGE